MIPNPITLNPMTNEELAIYKLVTDKYLITDYNRVQAKSNNCIDLDKDAKKMSDELIEFRKQNKQTHINFLIYANKLVLGNLIL